MSRIASALGRQGLLSLMLIAALTLCLSPMAVAGGSDGHIGGKPDIGQGDGIPQDKPGRIQAGEHNQNGDSNQGDEPCQDGGDGIPNEGPIEGDQHGGQGKFDSAMLTTLLLRLSMM